MIKIFKTDKCDTRTLDKDFTINDVYTDTIKHIIAVISASKFIAEKFLEQVSNHDYTKIGEYLPAFYEALKTRKVGEEFYKLDWWKIHETKERHHLNQHCPDDVNLIDVLEMICDCVCAGKARTGEVFPIKISNEILQQAVENTIKMLSENIEVVEDDDSNMDSILENLVK